MERIKPFRVRTPRDCPGIRRRGALAALLSIYAGLFFTSAALGSELTDWEVADEAAACDGYRAYLATYPDGTFTALARTRMSHACVGSDGNPDQSTATGGADRRLALKQALARVDEIPMGERQQALKALGYYAGEIDGTRGPQTEQAIRAFQTQHGYAATGRLDPEQMKPLFQEAAALAQEPDLDSQRRFGIMAAEGIGMLPDPDLALKWLGIAAARGDPAATYLLGKLHFDQLGSPSDARAFFEQAKALGDPRADSALQAESKQRRGVPNVMDELF